MNKRSPVRNLDDLNSNPRIQTILFYSFLVIFILFVVSAFFARQYFSDYVFREWLINYSHGFVRRGLPGTIFFFCEILLK